MSLPWTRRSLVSSWRSRKRSHFGASEWHPHVFASRVPKTHSRAAYGIPKATKPDQGPQRVKIPQGGREEAFHHCRSQESKRSGASSIPIRKTAVISGVKRWTYCGNISGGNYSPKHGMSRAAKQRVLKNQGIETVSQHGADNERCFYAQGPGHRSQGRVAKLLAHWRCGCHL